MITLSAKISLISQDAELSLYDLVEHNLVGNNISSPIEDVINTRKKITNPYLIGATKFSENGELTTKADFFIGDKLSDENGDFFEDETSGYTHIYVLGLSASSPINSITLAFDTYNNRFPKYISIENVGTFKDDDAIWTINFENAMDNIVMYIVGWSEGGYPLVITGIYTDIDIDIRKYNMISLSRTINDRSDIKFPSYGIISNSGNVEFNDVDGEIADYADNNLLTSDLRVTINLNNTLTKKSEQVGIFETRDWNYDNDNRSVSVSLRDDLEEWQDIPVEAINYDFLNPQSQTMQYFYTYFRSITPAKYKMLPFRRLDEKTQEILQETIIEFPFLNAGSLWAQWTKLCEVCGLYIYKNSNGETVCSYTYGS